jgi:diguanylate cyclase (GGDEF)-like protein
MLRILLVEDDEDDCVLIRDLLGAMEVMEVSMDHASSSTEGLASMLRREHDIYLLDYRLGESDGLELLRRARVEGWTGPVIVLTGVGNREIDLAAMRAGAADYLVKGEFTSEMLERSIRYALERSRLQAEMREMALRDELTGLFNRRGILGILEEEIERFRRYGRPLSILMVDVDGFKQVNDQFGHLVGDRVLTKVARSLDKGTRGVDKVGRFGEDEFLVVLPETPPSGAVHVAERLRRTVAELDIPLDGIIDPVNFTISVGLTGVPDHGETVDGLLGIADSAMYEGKRRSGNCVVYSDGRADFKEG